MSADRVTAVRLWAGTVVFGLFALAAWVRLLPLAPWEALLPSETGGMGVGYAGAGVIELVGAVLLPIIGNLLIIGEARRTRLGTQLRRLHLAAWLGAIVAAILLFRVPSSAFLWTLALAITLVPTQLTLLAATYAAAAWARQRAAA